MHFSKVDNDTAQVALDITHANCRLSTLQKTLSELEKETKTINDLVSHSEIEIAKRNQLIERKQGVINLYNKKMETMISQLGVCPLCPAPKLGFISQGITNEADKGDFTSAINRHKFLEDI